MLTQNILMKNNFFHFNNYDALSQVISMRFSNLFPKKKNFNLTGLMLFFKNLYYKTYLPENEIDILMQNKKQKINWKKQEKAFQLLQQQKMEKINSKIPLWKRKAIVIKNKPPKVKHIIFPSFLTFHIPPKVKRLYNSSDLKPLVDDMRTSFSNIKYNILFSGNPLITIPRDFIEKIHIKSNTSRAIEIMKRYDPFFELYIFEKEVGIIFKQMLIYAREENIPKLKKITGESAFALIKNDIKTRKDLKIKYLYKELIYVDTPEYQSSEIIGEDNVIMKFEVEVQEYVGKEINKIYKDKNVIENNKYIFEVARNPISFEEELGHNYMIINFLKIESVKQLI